MAFVIFVDTLLVSVLPERFDILFQLSEHQIRAIVAQQAVAPFVGPKLKVLVQACFHPRARRRFVVFVTVAQNKLAGFNGVEILASVVQPLDGGLGNTVPEAEMFLAMGQLLGIEGADFL